MVWANFGFIFVRNMGYHFNEIFKKKKKKKKKKKILKMYSSQSTAFGLVYLTAYQLLVFIYCPNFIHF